MQFRSITWLFKNFFQIFLIHNHWRYPPLTTKIHFMESVRLIFLHSSVLTKITLTCSSWSTYDTSMLGKFPNLRILPLVDLQKAQFCARNTSFLIVHIHLDNLVEGEVYVHSRVFAQLGYLFNEELFMLPNMSHEGFWSAMA